MLLHERVVNSVVANEPVLPAVPLRQGVAL